MQKLLWFEPFWIAALAPTLLFPGYFWDPALQPLFILLLFVGPLLRVYFSFRDQSLIEWFLVATILLGIWIATDRGLAWEVAGYTLLGINTYWSLIHWSPAQRRPEWVALLLCAMGVALALSGPMIVVGRPDPTLALIEQSQANMEFLGETVNHNVLAGGIILVAPLLLALGLGTDFRRLFGGLNRQRRDADKRKFFGLPWLSLLLGLLTIPVVASLPLTGSRGGYLAVVTSLAVVLMLRWPKLRYAIPVVGVSMLGALLYGWELKPFLDSLVGNDSLSGMDGRIEIWNRALYLIYDFPLTGAGLGMFGQVIPVLYPYFLFDAHIPHAHNLLLQIAADVGLPGLVCYVWIMGRVARGQSCRVAKLQSDKVTSTNNQQPATSNQQPATSNQQPATSNQLSIGVLGALVALVVHGIFDAVLWGTKLAFIPWLLFALGMLLADDGTRGWQDDRMTR